MATVSSVEVLIVYFPAGKVIQSSGVD